MLIVLVLSWLRAIALARFRGLMLEYLGVPRGVCLP